MMLWPHAANRNGPVFIRRSMGRFLMNLMMASGGYPWTIVPLERRADYMAALESASVSQNIRPFATFLSELVAKA